METDRELLSLAALAAGYDVTWVPYNEKGGGEFINRKPTVRECGGWRMTFDPLNNEGDRYRLARDLQLKIDFKYRVVAGPDFLVGWPENEPDEARAVVRCAAEIAKAQQGGGNAR